jgi:hypothetical protein
VTELERLERETGARTRTSQDAEAAYAKALQSPRTLSDLDVETIRHFYGDDFADRANAARNAPKSTEEKLANVVVDAIKTAVTPLRATIEALEQRIVELEGRPVVRDAGVWEANREYRPGDIISHNGAGWLCRAAHVSAGHAPDPSAFRMFVKSHR